MGNLLSHEESFRWTDPMIDKGEEIQILNTVLTQAIGYKDKIFKTPNLDTLILPWGNFIEFFLSYGYDETQRRTIFPWMTQIQHQTLTGILFSLRGHTPNRASDLISLQAEFPNENNAMFGFPCAPAPIRYVKCDPSLLQFHQDFVSTFNFQQQKDDFKYFKKFYVPRLKIPLQQFQRKINRHQVHTSIERIDDIRIAVHDKIHVHFNDQNEAALNIDGTWRHNVGDSYVIAEQAKRDLVELGFLLPDDCY